MNTTSIGDMASSLVLRARGTALKSSMTTLSQELASGTTSDVAGRLKGDYSYLTDIDHSLSRIGGYAVVASEAALFADAAQLGLEQMQGVVSSLGADILTINPTNIDAGRIQTGQQARTGLDSVLSALNGSVGGRSLFAGTATKTSPMASSDVLISALKSEISGMTLTSQILQTIDDWFADGGGFKATMYSGSDQSLAPLQVGVDEKVSLSLRADNAEFRSVLQNTAIAALAVDPDLGLDQASQNALLKTAGEGLLNNDLGLTGLRADLGYSQSRIEVAGSRTAAARTSLEFARNQLLAADPFETATRLEDVQFQLESLYTVTARASRLSLLSFLR